jgi:hypothetical protein
VVFAGVQQHQTAAAGLRYGGKFFVSDISRNIACKSLKKNTRMLSFIKEL